MKKILIAALMLLLMITGCENTPETGALRVITRSASTLSTDTTVIPMETVKYRITITDKAGTTKAVEATAEKSEVVEILQVGTYKVKAEALNVKNEVIGESTEKAVIIKAGEETLCDLNIEELKGKGTLSIKVDTDAEIPGITADIYQAAEGGEDRLVTSLELKKSGLSYTLTAELDNGFYLMKLKDNFGTQIGEMKTVRIVKGHETKYLASIGVTGEVVITITNAIRETPTITITSDSSSFFFSKGGTYTLSAATTGFNSPSFTWYLDNEKLSADKNTLSLTVPPDMLEGTHSITCIAKEGNVIWSESVEFTIPSPDKQIIRGVTDGSWIRLDADTLIPRDLEIEITGLDGGAKSLSYKKNGIRVSAKNGKTDIVYSMPAKYEDYTLRYEKRGENEHALILSRKDKANEELATLSVTYDIVIPFSEGEYAGLKLYRSEPGQEIWVEEGAGILPVDTSVNGTKTFRVLPGTYRIDGFTTNNWDRPEVTIAEFSDDRYTVEAGKTYTLTVTETEAIVSFGPIAFTENNKRFDGRFLYTDENGISAQKLVGRGMTHGEITTKVPLGKYHIEYQPFYSDVRYRSNGLVDITERKAEPIRIELSEQAIEKTFDMIVDGHWFREGDTLKASVRPQGIAAPAYEWTVDGEPVESADGTLSFPINDAAADGQKTHTVAVTVKDGAETVGTESRTIIVNPVETDSVTVNGPTVFRLHDRAVMKSLSYIDLWADGKHIANLGHEADHSRNAEYESEFAKDTVITGSTSEGFCSFITYQENGRTVVEVLHDRDIENAGYIRISVDYDFLPDSSDKLVLILEDHDSRVDGQHSESSVMVPVAKEADIRILKIDSGTWYNNTVYMHADDYYMYAHISPRILNIVSGETFDVTLVPYDQEKHE